MPTYTPPLRDMQFVLHELLNVSEGLRKLPPHADIDRETIDSILEEGGKFCSEVLFPLNQIGDREGCTYQGDGVVTTPTGFKEAYQQFVPVVDEHIKEHGKLRVSARGVRRLDSLRKAAHEAVRAGVGGLMLSTLLRSWGLSMRITRLPSSGRTSMHDVLPP